MTHTKELVEVVAAAGRAADEPEVVRAVRSLLLDHLAVNVRGAATDAARVFRSSTAALGSGTAPMPGSGSTSSPVIAAMANAVAAHAIEYDDVHNASSTHPGVAIFPAVLAAAQLGAADDRTVLRAVVMGYEAMCRVGRAANPPSHYARHFHPTGTVGTFGAAVAAAAVFGGDEAALAAAIGIAGSMPSGSMQFLIDGSWNKPLHPAVAARNGIEAGLLAVGGYFGTDDAVCGARGFLAGYCADPRPQALVEGAGTRPLEVVNTSIKAHTCCRYNQGVIDAVLAIRQEHGLSAADVTAVVAGVPTVATGIVLEPLAGKRRPRSVVDAQFSLPFGVAVALRHGRAGLDQYSDAELVSSETVRLMDLVEYVVDPAIDAVYPEQWRAWAEVTTTSGAVHRHVIEEPKGDPGNPLTDDELRAKFDDLTAGAWDSGRRDAVAAAVARFGEPGSLAALLALLS
jgi:2-methylcitrate dehydratase PrpD